MHHELISVTATAAGAGLTPGVAVAGDSLTIKNSRSAAMIISVWAALGASGSVGIKAPSLHDMVRGYQFNAVANELDPRLPLGLSLNPQPQETLTVSVEAGAASSNTVCMNVLYGDLPGVNSRMASWADIRERTEELTTVEMSLIGTGAGYTGAAALNSQSDLLKANRNYAILGATSSFDVPAVCVLGPDMGNVHVGVPGDSADNEYACSYFCTLARAFGKPLVPVISSGNKQSTFVSFVQPVGANLTPSVTLYLALLR